MTHSAAHPKYHFALLAAREASSLRGLWVASIVRSTQLNAPALS